MAFLALYLTTFYQRSCSYSKFKFSCSQPKPTDPNLQAAKGGGEDSGSNTPFIAVGIAGAIILIAVIVAVWLYNRRRKNKRCVQWFVLPSPP